MNAPAPKLTAPSAPKTSAAYEPPLLLVDVVTPESVTERKGLRRLGWMAAILAVCAPALEILSGGTPSGLLWISMVGGIGGVLAAERFRWRPASWFAAIGAIAWSFVAVERALVEPDGPWPALFLFVLGLAGLWHMRRAPAAGATLLTGAGLIMAYAAFGSSAESPYGGALAALSVSAALAGGSLRKLEPALGFGWLLACVGLFVLAGQPAGQPWLAPAFVLFAAIFFSIEALALPIVGRGGLMIAAIGALSPLMAIGVLYSAHIAPYGRAGEAAAYLGAALLQGGVLLLCARRLGDLKALGIAIAPAGAAIVASLVAAAVIGLGEVWATAALATAAMLFTRLHQRTPHRAWAAISIALMIAAIVECGVAMHILSQGVTGMTALAFIALALCAPALASGIAARGFKTPTPALNAIFESLAIAFGALALSGVVRWIATDGAPATGALGFAEAGAHASVWLGAGGLLSLCPERGVQSVRRVAARALFALGVVALAAGTFAWLNPWWGVSAAPVEGGAALNTLAMGYLAPALVLVGLVWLAQRRRAERIAIATACASGLCLLLWLALELRRDLHGAAIDGAGVLGPENLWLSALLLTTAIALYRLRRLERAEAAGAALLTLLILGKVALIDLYQPADGWRAGSFVLLALAAAVLAAPRAETARAARPANDQGRPRPELWSMAKRLAARA